MGDQHPRDGAHMGKVLCSGERSRGGAMRNVFTSIIAAVGFRGGGMGYCSVELVSGRVSSLRVLLCCCFHCSKGS